MHAVCEAQAKRKFIGDQFSAEATNWAQYVVTCSWVLRFLQTCWCLLTGGVMSDAAFRYLAR